MNTHAAGVGGAPRSAAAGLGCAAARETTVVAFNRETAAGLAALLPLSAPPETVFLADGRVSPEDLGEPLGPWLLPGRVLLLDTSQASRDLAGWAVARAGASLVWAVDELSADVDTVRAHRVVLGGSHRLVHEIDRSAPAIVLAQPRRVDAAVVDSLPITDLTATTPRRRVRVLERDSFSGPELALGAARIVVSIGRGIGGPEHIPLFRKLADRLGAALGASRVAVDSGWMPFAAQVGQTGTAVAPDLYLAFGISGAIQHLAGIRAAKRIVAVNTDLEAPLCRVADLVIHGDAVEVATRVLESLEKETAQ